MGELAPLRVGISTCLLGERVRFDGGHKRDGFSVDTLGPFVEWFPVCPEFEMGLGAPRERMRLVGEVDDPRLVALPSGVDLTEQMDRFNRTALERVADAGLHGFILKSDSPTCGVFRVRVYRDEQPQRTGRGLWAAALSERFPLLPLEEEGRLRDAAIRENFIARLFAFHRWSTFVAEPVTAARLQRFHAENKMLLMAHDPVTYRQLGPLVASASRRVARATVDAYAEGYMRALGARATRKRNTDVLAHLQGFLKRVLETDDRAELTRTIEDYRTGLVPLIVPITLLRHHLRKHPVEWAVRQTYLDPYPAELMLRNHV